METWYGFDLDGTLAHYDGWRGAKHIGEPIEPMVNLAKRLLKEGVKVKIFTARCSDSESETAIKHIEKWCEKHIGQKLEVTNVKDFGMKCLYDDRCKQILCNKGLMIEQALIDSYQTIDDLRSKLKEIEDRKNENVE